MKICMVLTNGFDPDVRVYQEALYLTSLGAQVEILCWDRSRNAPEPETEILDGITITRRFCQSELGSGIKQMPSFIRFIMWVKRYLKSHHYDYYHLHDIDGGIVGMFALPRHAKYVFDMHEFYELGSTLRKTLSRRIALHVIRKSLASLYENNIYLKPPYAQYRDKLFSLKNYPDTDYIQRKEKTQSDVFRIGYHGAVRSQIPQFSALFEAVKTMPDVSVEINGLGIDHAKLVEMAKAYDNVQVHGLYNGLKESTRLYQNTDVLFCGYTKHSPNHQKDAEAVKFFEAILTATPMIMQCEIGMGDKVVSRGYGLAVETDNAAEIRDAIQKFKTDRAFYQRCQQNEIRDAGQYSWQSEVAVLKRIYQL